MHEEPQLIWCCKSCISHLLFLSKKRNVIGIYGEDEKCWPVICNRIIKMEWLLDMGYREIFSIIPCTLQSLFGQKDKISNLDIAIFFPAIHIMISLVVSKPPETRWKILFKICMILQWNRIGAKNCMEEKWGGICCKKGWLSEPSWKKDGGDNE